MVYIPGLRNLGSYSIDDDPVSGKVEITYYECGHCCSHFKRQPKQPAPDMCRMCMVWVCPREECSDCIPFEAKLEAMEGKRRLWKQMEIPKSLT